MKNPLNVKLAAEIKLIDDDITRSIEQSERQWVENNSMNLPFKQSNLQMNV